MSFSATPTPTYSVGVFSLDGGCPIINEFVALTRDSNSALHVDILTAAQFEAICKGEGPSLHVLILTIQQSIESPSEFFRAKAKLLQRVPTLLVIPSNLPQLATEGLAWGASDFVLSDKEKACNFFGVITSLLHRHELGNALSLGTQIAEEFQMIERQLSLDARQATRDPLMSILGITKMLLERTSTPDVRAGLEMVNLAARQLHELVDNWPSLPNAEEGSPGQRHTKFSLRSQVLHILGLLAPEARRQNVGLFYDFVSPERGEVLVTGDLQSLRHSLVLLVGNLVKLVGATGVVKVSCCVSKNELMPKACSLNVVIGCVTSESISETTLLPNTAECLRFRSAVQQTLAMGDFLVRGSRGLMTVERWAQVGCRIRLVIPYLVPADTTDAPRSLSESEELTENHRPIRVLVAEDSVVNQTLLQRFLSKRGYEAVIVSDGLAAIERFRTEPFDVILMDLRMPECDGDEATKEIRSLERLSGTHCPIFAITAHLDAGDRDFCLANGFDELFVKPVDLKALESALAKIRDAITFAAEEVVSEQPKA